MKRCNHNWARGWSDGVTGRLVCTDCKKGLLVPVSDLAWWGTKRKAEQAPELAEMAGLSAAGAAGFDPDAQRFIATDPRQESNQ